MKKLTFTILSKRHRGHSLRFGRLSYDHGRRQYRVQEDVHREHDRQPERQRGSLDALGRGGAGAQNIDRHAAWPAKCREALRLLSPQPKRPAQTLLS